MIIKGTKYPPHSTPNVQNYCAIKFQESLYSQKKETIYKFSINPISKYSTQCRNDRFRTTLTPTFELLSSSITYFLIGREVLKKVSWNLGDTSSQFPYVTQFFSIFQELRISPLFETLTSIPCTNQFWCCSSSSFSSESFVCKSNLILLVLKHFWVRFLDLWVWIERTFIGTLPFFLPMSRSGNSGRLFNPCRVRDAESMKIFICGYKIW